MLPNLKADILGVISGDGDPWRALGPYIGTLGEAPVTWGLVKIVTALRDDTSPRCL